MTSERFSKKIIFPVVVLSLLLFIFSLALSSTVLAQGVGEEGDNDHDGIIEKGPADFDTDNDGKINREFFGYKDQFVDFTKMKWEEFDDDRDGDGITDDDDKYDPPIRVGGLILTDASFDHDGDGVPDEKDVDDDNDGILDKDEKPGRRLDFDNDGIPDKKDSDKDGDKLPEADGKNYVDANGDGRDDATGVDLDPSPWDKDNDGVQDGWERVLGRDPNDDGDKNKDTDRDGFSDLVEIQRGTDPSNPESKPTGAPPAPPAPQEKKSAESPEISSGELIKDKGKNYVKRKLTFGPFEFTVTINLFDTDKTGEDFKIVPPPGWKVKKENEKKHEDGTKSHQIVAYDDRGNKVILLTVIIDSGGSSYLYGSKYPALAVAEKLLPPPSPVPPPQEKKGFLDRLGDTIGKLLGKPKVQEEELSDADKALLEAEREAERLESVLKAEEAEEKAKKLEAAEKDKAEWEETLRKLRTLKELRRNIYWDPITGVFYEFKNNRLIKRDPSLFAQEAEWEETLRKLRTLKEIRKDLYLDPVTGTYHEFKDNRLKEASPLDQVIYSSQRILESLINSIGLILSKIDVLDKKFDTFGAKLDALSAKESQPSREEPKPIITREQRILNLRITSDADPNNKFRVGVNCPSTFCLVTSEALTSTLTLVSTDSKKVTSGYSEIEFILPPGAVVGKITGAAFFDENLYAHAISASGATGGGAAGAGGGGGGEDR